VCAKEIIRATNNEADLSLRISIHEGDMVYKGNDVNGEGVNIASWLLLEAVEGDICVPGTMYQEIKNKTGLQARIVEEKTLKNGDRQAMDSKMNIY
jgi:adenylate cyclase